MKDLVILPSGRGINLAQIAFFTPASGKLQVTFSATFAASEMIQPLELDLQGDDAVAFLKEVETRGNISAEPAIRAAGLPI